MNIKTIVVILTLVPVSTTVFASDGDNLCKFNLDPPSENISLPHDDEMHYPSQWTGDPGKTNLHNPFSGLEFIYRGYHWIAERVDEGTEVRLDGFAVYVAAFLPSPFSNGELDWVRVVVANFVGPDGISHQYAYAAPGEFSPAQESFDVAIGGPNESIVLQVTDTGMMEPVADPSSFITRMRGSSGTNSYHDFTSTDGFIEIHTEEESLANPNYVLSDGYDPIWRYYFTRPWMSSWGTIRYNNVEYNVTGYAREDHGWQQNLPEWAFFQYRWTAIQIMGCLNPQGHEISCDEEMHSFFAWDNWHVSDGTPVSPYWNEVEPPKHCEEYMMTHIGDWQFTPLDYWVSPRTGIQFARQTQVSSPSRGVELYLTPVIDDQEIYKAGFIFPGFYHGAMTVNGTINGKSVWGNAMVEQWNMTE